MILLYNLYVVLCVYCKSLGGGGGGFLLGLICLNVCFMMSE